MGVWRCGTHSVLPFWPETQKGSEVQHYIFLDFKDLCFALYTFCANRHCEV